MLQSACKTPGFNQNIYNLVQGTYTALLERGAGGMAYDSAQYARHPHPVEKLVQFLAQCAA